MIFFADFSASNPKNWFNELFALYQYVYNERKRSSVELQNEMLMADCLINLFRVVSLSLFAFIIVLQDGRLMCLLIHRYALEVCEQCSVFTSSFRRIRTTLSTKHIHF